MVGKFWPVLSDPDIVDIVRVSLQGGINWFDTAESYGWGASEQALDQALSALGQLGKEALIATKWWPVMRTASSITKTIEERTRQLGGRTIHLYQIHQPYSFSTVRSQMREMSKLLKDGHIVHAGVSNFSAEKMRVAHRVLADYGFPLVSNQVKYSMLDRRIERNGIMQAAQELGMTIIAYSPLEQGLLTGKFHNDPSLVRAASGPRKFQSKFKAAGLSKSKPVIQLLEHMASAYGVSPSQIALNWLVNSHGDTVVAIPGASKVRHAEENIGALTFRLSKEHLDQLSDISSIY
jgi:aryl-alcohol dehydrogenase-like predicted oxidoreductase